jgi:hypothetical protein
VIAIIGILVAQVVLPSRGRDRHRIHAEDEIAVERRVEIVDYRKRAIYLRNASISYTAAH